MTIDEAIYCMKSYVPEYGGYELCDGCKYYASKEISKNGFVCSSGEARKIAIEALERLRDNKQQCNTNEMDINDVIHCMYSYLDEDTKETCRNCRYYSFMTSDGEMSYCKSAEAHKMAVEALEKLKVAMHCNDCKYKLNLKKYDYSQGGCKHSDEDGYVCMAFSDEGIAIHMIGANPDNERCEMYNTKIKTKGELK